MAANRGPGLCAVILFWFLTALVTPACAQPHGDLVNTGAATGTEAGASEAVVDPAALAAELGPLLWDEAEMVEALGEIRHFREAGFIYQPELAFSMMMEEAGMAGMRRDDADWRAVASGFVAVDRAYAFFFGSADDVAREQRVMKGLLPGGSVKELEAPAIARLQADVDTAQGRHELARIACGTTDRLLAAVGTSERAMRFLGAHLYGVFIESLYMTSVMVLAAAEEDLLEPLARVRPGTTDRLREELELLAGHGCLGEREKSDARAQTFRRLAELMTANNSRPPLANLREVVRITRDERYGFLDATAQDNP